MRAINLVEATFEVPSANATNGAPKDVKRFDCSNAAVQVTWTSGSFELQGSMDGTNWAVIQGTIGANTVVVLTSFWRLLRMRCVTAGTASAVLGAHELIY